MRLAAFLIVCSIAASAHAVGPILPAVLQPGDHYQLMFATSFTTVIDTDTSVPPATPYFGGLDAADYTVTYAAYQAGLLPEWNFADLTYHAVLSTNGHNAKDRLDIEAPIYNTHGDLIATNAADLWDGSIANPVGYDEYAEYIFSDQAVWTGTLGSGLWAGASAGDWNDPASIARTGLTYLRQGWIDGSASPANDARRLYGLSPVLTVPLPGDYNSDGVVDAADYVLWRDTLGQSSSSGYVPADGDGDGKVDQADYDIWRSNFGRRYGSGSASVNSTDVPEPSSFTLLCLSLAVLLAAKPTRR